MTAKELYSKLRKDISGTIKVIPDPPRSFRIYLYDDTKYLALIRWVRKSKKFGLVRHCEYNYKTKDYYAIIKIERLIAANKKIYNNN